MRPEERARLGTVPPVAVGAREDTGAERAGFRAGAVLGLLIRCYQVLFSPALGPSCRFVPSCSEYTRQALRRYGAARGLALGLRRLLRCHPFHPGGWDPVE